jgi:DNA-binding transcriptional MerR regulator
MTTRTTEKAYYSTNHPTKKRSVDLTVILSRHIVEGVSDKTYKLEELAEKAGTSARTVRYYVQRGLLPAPVFRGKDSAYSHEHVVRLRAIRRLQDRFLPLDAIQAELAGKSLEEIEEIAAGTSVATAAAKAVTDKDEPRESEPERWQRFELLPGLELHVVEGASPRLMKVVVELVKEIRERAKQG